MHAQRSARSVTVLLATVITLAAATGVAGTALLLNPGTPESLTPKPNAATVAVETIDYTDDLSAKLVLHRQPDIKLTLHTAGRVTGTVCTPGAELTSGSVPLTVDTVPLIMLATQLPLYRDLQPGDRGADVDALLAELHRLDANVVEYGVVSTNTMNALSQLFVNAGYPRERFTTIPFARIVWLPQAAVTVTACDAQLAQGISDATEYATVAGSLRSATVEYATPPTLAGPRLFTSEGMSVATGDTGEISDSAALATIAGLPGYAAATRSTDPLPIEGVWRLVDALPVATLPPSVLTQVTATTACVWEGDTGIPVTIVSSQLGQSYVRPLTGELPKRVATSPPTNTPCEP